MKKEAEDIDVSPDVEMLDTRAITNSSLVIDKTKHDGRVASSGSRHAVPIKPMRRLTPNDGVKTPPPLPSIIFPEDGDDPFLANKPLDMKKTDTTYPVDNLNIHPRRINLRESLNATRRSCTRASTSSTSGHSITSFLLPEDQELINRVGFSFVMARIAKNYGFDVDVAKETFFKTKSIEKTKSVLQDCKEAACMAANNRLARDDIESSSDEAPQSRRGHSSSRKKSASNSGSQKAKFSSASRRANRPSLKFKPRPCDEAIDALSEYSPPHVSRAGQFNRLVKEGRREEAIDRERRRASGVFIPQTQIQSYHEDQRQQSVSPLPNSSPIPKSGQELDIDNDVRPPLMVPHEDPAQHQPPNDISSPVVDIHQIFFKRISEGRSSLNEDEDDPAVLKLAQEHRDLVMNVTEENADGLRRFEEQNNQDLLRLWSLDWVRQKIADM